MSFEKAYDMALAASGIVPTPMSEISVKHSYPGIMGERGQVSSKAGPHGVEQQFIDRRLQKEINLSRRTAGQGSGGKYNFVWTLNFYTHPGMRAEVPVEPKVLPDLVDYLHALAVGVAPKDRLEQRNDDWIVFHTYGLGGKFGTGKDALKYLKQNHFAWSNVEKNIGEYGIKTYKRA
jgi:hypothetical protein